MHSKSLIVSILLGFFLVSCSFMPNEMKLAEKIMETNPDSALQILQKIHPNQAFTDADRALYGLLLFQALEKSNKPLKPDSVISFSLRYYQSTNNKPRLATSYFYKAKLYKVAQRFDDATLLYLKALDLIQNSKDYHLLGKIYSDMGDICSLQTDYIEALKKYQESINNYKSAGDTIEASYKVIDIGRMYRFLKDYKKAQHYYMLALSQTPDSMLQGSAYQEIGVNYYKAQLIDSAKYFLSKSLLYPYKATNYAIRCYFLSELYFDKQLYDSAFRYAALAIKYPSTFYNQRDCYRILANTEYSRGDFKKVAYYLSKYQDCVDSVRKIETQTKTSVLEDMHQTNGAFSKSKQYVIIFVCIIPILILLSLFIVYRLRKRNKKKEEELVQAEVKLTEKQTLLKDSLIQKIEESKVLQTSHLSKISIAQREQIYKDIYMICLHLNDWEAFKKLMNQTFNNLVKSLETKYTDLNQKELIWSCLFLLDVPTNDITIILDCQVGSLYKLKQRLAQKMNLSSTKELEHILHELSENN